MVKESYAKKLKKSARRIYSFRRFAHLMTILLMIVSLVIGAVLICSANKNFDGKYDHNPFEDLEFDYVKLAYGAGFTIVAILVCIFIWKSTTVLCDFYLDVKTIRLSKDEYSVNTVRDYNR